MPVDGPEGLRITVCTGQGAMAMSAEALFGEKREVPPAGADQGDCVFAGAGVPLLPPMPAAVVATGLLRLDAMPPTGPPTRPVGPVRHFRPPAQAPPLQD